MIVYTDKERLVKNMAVSKVLETAAFIINDRHPNSKKPTWDDVPALAKYKKDDKVTVEEYNILQEAVIRTYRTRPGVPTKSVVLSASTLR
jgi:hypothetical protein